MASVYIAICSPAGTQVIATGAARNHRVIFINFLLTAILLPAVFGFGGQCWRYGSGTSCALSWCLQYLVWVLALSGAVDRNFKGR